MLGTCLSGGLFFGIAAHSQLDRAAKELSGLGGEVWEEGSPVRRMAGKPLRFPVALSAGRQRGAWSLPALQARPGISEPQPQLLLTAKYFTPETCYTS